MNHRNLLGCSKVIAAGGVQSMSAGSGLRHEEHNVGGGDVNFLQIWIEPKRQNVTPRYQRHRAALAGWAGSGHVHLDCAADTRFLLIEVPINH